MNILRRIAKGFGWTSLFIVALIFFFVWTFPVNMLKPQVEAQLAKVLSGPQEPGSVRVRIEELDLSGLSTLVMKRTQITWSREKDDPEPELLIDEARAKIGLWGLLTSKPDIDFYAELLGGTIEGDVQLLKKGALRDLNLKIDGLDFSAWVGDDIYLGTPFSGRLNGNAELHLGTNPAKDAEGKIELKGDGFALGAGKFPVGLISQVPGAGMAAIMLQDADMDQVSLGTLSAQVNVSKGQAVIQKSGFVGGDIEANIEGETRLDKNLMRSRLKLGGGLLLKDTLKSKKGIDVLVTMGSSFLEPMKNDEGLIEFSLNGPLSRPTFRQGKQRSARIKSKRR